MAKFKNGTAVKLRDDVEYGKDYNGLTLREGRWAIKGEKYTVSDPENRGLGYTYLLDETGFYIGEDALEAWPESTEETMSNEIDPKLFEIFKVIVGGFAANPSICYDHKGDIFLPIEPAINFAKESVRLLREEKSVISDFDKGYEKGYQDATTEACNEISKNYKPNRQ
jgi:hypothetical protein